MNNEPDAGYDKDLKVSYWFSYNRDQLVIKYGKGHVMDETTLLEYDFLAVSCRSNKFYYSICLQYTQRWECVCFWA